MDPTTGSNSYNNNYRYKSNSNNNQLRHDPNDNHDYSNNDDDNNMLLLSPSLTDDAGRIFLNNDNDDASSEEDSTNKIISEAIQENFNNNNNDDDDFEEENDEEEKVEYPTALQPDERDAILMYNNNTTFTYPTVLETRTFVPQQQQQQQRRRRNEEATINNNNSNNNNNNVIAASSSLLTLLQVPKRNRMEYFNKDIGKQFRLTARTYKDHMPVQDNNTTSRKKKKRRCLMCSCDTTVQCNTCQISLCKYPFGTNTQSCYEIFHTVNTLHPIQRNGATSRCYTQPKGAAASIKKRKVGSSSSSQQQPKTKKLKKSLSNKKVKHTTTTTKTNKEQQEKEDEEQQQQQKDENRIIEEEQNQLPKNKSKSKAVKRRTATTTSEDQVEQQQQQQQQPQQQLEEETNQTTSTKDNTTTNNNNTTNKSLKIEIPKKYRIDFFNTKEGKRIRLYSNGPMDHRTIPDAKRRCLLCRCDTTVRCSTCQVQLCRNPFGMNTKSCYQLFHEKRILKFIPRNGEVSYQNRKPPEKLITTTEPVTEPPITPVAIPKRNRINFYNRNIGKNIRLLAKSSMDHMPIKDTKKRCLLCKCDTTVRCNTCQVQLCKYPFGNNTIGCFQSFHTEDVLIITPRNGLTSRHYTKLKGPPRLRQQQQQPTTALALPLNTQQQQQQPPPIFDQKFCTDCNTNDNRNVVKPIKTKDMKRREQLQNRRKYKEVDKVPSIMMIRIPKRNRLSFYNKDGKRRRLTATNAMDHMPTLYKKGRCLLCHCETTVRCMTCQVHICKYPFGTNQRSCFENFHSNDTLHAVDRNGERFHKRKEKAPVNNNNNNNTTNTTTQEASIVEPREEEVTAAIPLPNTTTTTLHPQIVEQVMENNNYFGR